MAAAVFILASSVTAAITAGGGCRPVPALILSLDDPIQEVNITDIQAKAKFCGWARIEGLVGERCVIRLSVRVETGWEAEVQPSTMVITDYQKHGFNVTVRVPPETNNGTAVVVVEGSGRSGDGYNTGYYQGMTEGLISICAFEKILLETERPFLELGPSGDVRFNLSVVNGGNTNLSYNLWVSNGGSLSDHGWTARLPSHQGNLSIRGRANHIVEIISPKNMFELQSGMTAVIISLTTQTSLESEPVVKAYIRFLVLTKADLPPLFEPLALTLVLCLVVAGIFTARSRAFARGWRRSGKVAGGRAPHPGTVVGPRGKKW